MPYRGEKLPYGIVAAKIWSVHDHPRGDRDWVAMVDLGGSQLVQVVFGGTYRLRVGDMVVAAPPGARLPDDKKPTGRKMRRRTFRGVSSFGMLCSAAEVGWDASRPNEVARLEGDLVPGMPLDEGMGGVHLLKEPRDDMGTPPRGIPALA